MTAVLRLSGVLLLLLFALVARMRTWRRRKRLLCPCNWEESTFPLSLRQTSEKVSPNSRRITSRFFLVNFVLRQQLFILILLFRVVYDSSDSLWSWRLERLSKPDGSKYSTYTDPFILSIRLKGFRFPHTQFLFFSSECIYSEESSSYPLNGLGVRRENYRVLESDSSCVNYDTLPSWT